MVQRPWLGNGNVGRDVDAAILDVWGCGGEDFWLPGVDMISYQAECDLNHETTYGAVSLRTIV